MKAPVTKFNKWILDKILNTLSIKEGCVVNDFNYTADGAKTVIMDSFGFIYEINIKTVGRVRHEQPNN